MLEHNKLLKFHMHGIRS